MADSHHENHEHRENHANVVRHEQSDANITAVLGFGAGLFVVIVAVCLIILGVFGFFDRREGVQAPSEYPLAAAQGQRVPPEPRLQTDPRQDLANLRAREDQQLGSYGWVDRNAGVVRIPIDTAMRLTLERGLPARTEQPR